MLYVDLKAAYDSVDKKKNIRSQMRTREKFVRMIKVCVQGSKCKINFEGAYSNNFPVLAKCWADRIS